MRHNNRTHTLQEISKLLGLSISAVTSSESKAMNKLQKKIALLSYNE
jgi:DNA-directed RNA polymerase sigma subunit (sigma70/sigma32)